MSADHSYRSPSNPASIELRCPHCERDFHLAPPEALVTLTTCPHLDCQHVALVCTGVALGRDLVGWSPADNIVAVTLERFLAPAGGYMGALLGALVALGLFIVPPLSMWAYARDEPPERLICLAGFTIPTALFGIAMIIFAFVDVMHSFKERQRIAALRSEAFSRARWQPSYPNRTL